MKIAGCVVSEDECDCHCHKDPENVKHVMACCHWCPHCSRNIRVGFYAKHVELCAEEKRACE